MRSLVRERYLKAQDSQTPFQLIRWADGRLTIDDPTTGRRIDLARVRSGERSVLCTIDAREGDIQ